MKPDAVRFVLVRPEEAGNVGAAARVLKNFGFSHLVLVSPRMARPEDGFKWARGAEEILEGATIVEELAEAVHPCVSAWAATRRRGKLRGGYVSPRHAAEASARSAAGGESVAWVFGPESRGLRTEEVRQCTGRVTIPTAPEHASLNLAQAVAVCAYEVHLAVSGSGGAAPRKGAPIEDREALYRHLETGLGAIGFLKPRTEVARMTVLRNILERSHLTPSETRFLRGIARRAEWAGRMLGSARDEEDPEA